MRWLLLAAALVAKPALAQEREFCAERPGLNTPACTAEPGHGYVETSLANWTLERQGHDRTDTLLVADTLVRVGIGKAAEARIGWTPFGHVRERGQGTTDGVGDVTLGLKANLLHPDGDKLALAVLPYVTLPVGRTPVGAGDWAAGVLLPVTFELSDTVSLAGTPEIDAAVDEDGHGRHVQFGSAAGLSIDLTDAVTVEPEVELLRDDDPGGHRTEALASLALAVKLGERLQLDVQGAAGLNRDSPDVQLLGGVAARF